MHFFVFNVIFFCIFYIIFCSFFYNMQQFSQILGFKENVFKIIVLLLLLEDFRL